MLRGVAEDERTAEGWTPICLAALDGSPMLVSALLEQHADVNDRMKRPSLIPVFGFRIGLLGSGTCSLALYFLLVKVYFGTGGSGTQLAGLTLHPNTRKAERACQPVRTRHALAPHVRLSYEQRGPCGSAKGFGFGQVLHGRPERTSKLRSLNPATILRRQN